MLTLIGAKALSPSKSKKLLAQLQNISEVITDLHSHFCHFVDIADDQTLNQEQSNVLERLLTYGDGLSDFQQSDDDTLAYKTLELIVLPRLGT
ncbi:MAG: hypothetical protein HQL46_05285, partial [Gammaproteobacteria bacterium]|nr:hypothetical protein [Gammaproteobacteria bacterium]